MEPHALILDGNQRASLAATRSLGKRGIRVTVGEIVRPSLAGSSRYCGGQALYSDPFASPESFLHDVMALVVSQEITFLLPISEATTYIILKNRHLLPDHVVLPFPEDPDLEKLSNKNRLFRLAHELGHPYPESIWCSGFDEGFRALEGIERFPIVLKPFKSRILLLDRILSTRVLVAHSRREAEAALRENEFFSYPFTIQSYIEGQGQGLFALYRNGHAVCFFAHRRLREKPPEGGVSVLSESVPVDSRMRTIADSILKQANWNGVAMVEFRVTRDGTPYLMEVNPRFWGSLQLAIDSGVDFPYLLYKTHTSSEPIAAPIYEKQRLRWFLGDLDRLYLVLKAPREKISFFSKLSNLIAFFVPHPRTRHEINRLGDMAPFWFELKSYIRQLW